MVDPFSIKSQVAKSADLVHRIRFNQLGRRQRQIADLLSIDPRAWRYLRNGQKNFSSALASRAEIMLLVHRMADVSLRSSRLSKAMSTSIKRASSLDDLKVNAAELDDLLKGELESQDYGLLGLSGAVYFAIWVLGSNFSTRTLASVDYLNMAIARWDTAAKLAPDLAGKTYAINTRTARIYKDVFILSDKPMPQPSTDHHNAYREYAKIINSVPAWRDALEQATLLEDSARINQDFAALRCAMESSVISLENQYEVVLRELQSIDNASALEREPAFQAWVEDITNQYKVWRRMATQSMKKGATA